MVTPSQMQEVFLRYWRKYFYSLFREMHVELGFHWLALTLSALLAGRFYAGHGDTLTNARCIS